MAFLLRRLSNNFYIQVRYRRLRKRKPIDNSLIWAEPLIQTFGENFNIPQVDDDKEPAKLHMVYLTKKLNGRPYWEKDAAKQLNLDKVNSVVVHKNTPENNELLKMIKHLVRILPVTFPHGLPDSVDDYAHCYLRDNGEFVVQKRIDPSRVVEVSEDDSSQSSQQTLDNETVKRANSLKLTNYLLNTEYFPAKYTYTKNQDGKEYRYKGNSNIGANRDWY